MNKYDNYFKETYGAGVEMTVTTECGIVLHGVMYGNDECFDLNDFYQVLVSDGKIYYCFYLFDGLDENMDLSNIDYGHPWKIEEVTNKYEYIF